MAGGEERSETLVRLPHLKPILLHPDDNVLVLAEPIQAGQTLEIDGRSVVAPDDVAVGHKIARWPLAVGDKVLKYGAPIGSMTVSAAAGAHVHVHNMKSDYIASHSRQATGGDPNSEGKA